MIIINKNRPIRFKIKGLIIIILSEPRNDCNHTSGGSDQAVVAPGLAGPAWAPPPPAAAIATAVARYFGAFGPAT